MPQAAALDFALRALAAGSEQLSEHLARGGPSSYLCRFLSTLATAEPVSDDRCGCS